MSSLTTYGEGLLLKKAFNIAPPPITTGLYFGIGNGASEAGLTTEVTAIDYTRLAMPIASWSTATAKVIVYNAALNFPGTTSTWGQATHWGVFDSPSGGNCLLYGPFSATLSISSSSTLSIDSGAVILTLSAAASGNGMTTALAARLLNFMTGKADYASETLYVGFNSQGLTETSPIQAEPPGGGTGYVRQPIGSLSFLETNLTTIANSADIVYSALTDWQYIAAIFITRSLTSTLAEDILFIGSIPTMYVLAGKEIAISANTLKIRLM